MLGRAPSEVRRLPVRDVYLLRRYWDEEPWGPWRDNIHAAIIAREVIRPYAGRRKLSLDPYMLIPEEIRRDGASKKLIATLKSIATPVTAGKGTDDRSRKTGRPTRSRDR